MGNLKEQLAYLQGLTKGLNLTENSAEGKMLLKIVDVLDDVAEEMQCMSVAQEDLETYVETIDEDLTDLEDEVYADEYDEEEPDDTDEYEIIADDAIDEDFVEVACPVCHEEVTFEADILDDEDAVEVTCPYCGGTVYDNTLAFEEKESTSSRNTRHRIHPGI